MTEELNMQYLEGLVTPLIELCAAAGAVISEHYRAPGAGQYRRKDDDSPLTRADLASDRVLQQGLAALRPALPVLSEESGAAQASARRQWSRYWLIDPLDGTKEFLARSGEFTINVALVDAHRPVLGLLYLPLQDYAYVGIPGRGAWRYSRAPDGGWSPTALATRPLRAGRPLVVLASRRHRSQRLQDCLQWLQRHWGEYQRRDSGSALKFCQLAEGAGDIYPRFSPCCEWDTAAGQALLEGAGGGLLDLQGRALRYNERRSLYSPHFVALADAGHSLWQSLLAELGAAR